MELVCKHCGYSIRIKDLTGDGETSMAIILARADARHRCSKPQTKGMVR